MDLIYSICIEKGFSGRNCLNDFEGRLGKKLKNSLGIKALVFLKTRILGVIPPKYETGP